MNETTMHALDFLAEPPSLDVSPALSEELTFPAPWFGGKRRAAAMIWERIGDVDNWVEFFGGSGAVTLARPAEHRARVETINDLDSLLANFWRALRAAPEALADACDCPVIEVDLHARHRALIARRESLSAELEADPRAYDLEAAAWWVWGASAWIGDGWCNGKPTRGLPNLGGSCNNGKPVVNFGKGIHGAYARAALHDTFTRLAARLRYVRFPCGDWTRVATPAVTWRHGLTGILIDPPYPAGKVDYAVGSRGVAKDVHAWALAHGDDARMRIAFCGYEGDFAFPNTWECVPWKAKGGYGNQRQDGENENARRERIWFSPHCLKAVQASLFQGL